MHGLERAFVVGMGEVGRRIAAAIGAAGVEVVPVTRTSGWPRALSDEPGARLLCVREEVLPEVLERLEPVPARDLVSIQNGWIRPLLPSPEIGRGLIWFTAKGDFFRCLRPSPFVGLWAGHLAAALDAGGIPALAVSISEFDALEADKMGFNCVVGLPLAVHGVALGEYLEGHTDEARALFEESVAVCAAALGCAAAADGWDRFLESAAPLGWVRVPRAKALELRNGAVARLARELGRQSPVTDALLAAHERL